MKAMRILFLVDGFELSFRNRYLDLLFCENKHQVLTVNLKTCCCFVFVRKLYFLMCNITCMVLQCMYQNKFYIYNYFESFLNTNGIIQIICWNRKFPQIKKDMHNRVRLNTIKKSLTSSFEY